ncbi:PH domain-containing protein [Speluncibacter jeojiensis]|uniref:PH domain-containing protein n=1 Tax=Speluncibacter jeojiensis TaxID=2710754 RepID=A0A9X4LZ57_9ACTN|nr:PH domain-containing protein [Rhodococcus sp. D2-41]MDG3014065.1 PH domain-containing protein [Corynebacteriales bacterium D3-21]
MPSPQQSTPDDTPDAQSGVRSPAPAVIRIPATAHLAEVVLLLLLTLPAFTWPAASAWLLAIPVLLAVWTERVRTEVSTSGLRVRTFTGSRQIGWDQLKGLHFPRNRWARAELTDGTPVSLPAVHFRQVSILAAASGGRIPDPYAADTSPTADAAPADDVAAGDAVADNPQTPPVERDRPQDRADDPRE